jgi:phosphohistidine phosphatase
MKLYFLRHTEALDGMNDAARPLSARGRHQAEAIGEFLARVGIGMDAAYSSPLVRAWQTAELVLGRGGGVEPDGLQRVDALLNEATVRGFEGWLRSLPVARHILLVGHNPSLSERVSALLGMPEHGGLDLPKGGLACVRSPDGRNGTLKFYVTPKLLGAG